MVTDNRVWRKRLLLVLLPAALACILFAPRTSEGKGLILITHGDDISHIADIPPQIIDSVKQSTGATNPAIGYKYGEFGIFFLNIWTWGGEYVVYENDTYWDLGAEGAAQMLGVGVGDLPKPMTYTFPPGLVIIILLIVGFLVYTFVFAKKEDDTAPAGSVLAADASAATDSPGGAPDVAIDTDEEKS